MVYVATKGYSNPVSKLFSADEPEDVRRSFVRTAIKGPVLRRNRKRPLHPEEIHARLRDKSVQEMPQTGWHWPFGWLLVLWCPDGTKRYRDLSSKHTYADAVRERDAELAFEDYEGATLIRKTYEKK